MNGLDSHPFPVEGSGMILPILFPVLAFEDDTITEHGYQLGMGYPNVASQLCPLYYLGCIQNLPKAGNGPRYSCEEQQWGESGSRRRSDRR
jgi:hypothetical protein